MLAHDEARLALVQSTQQGFGAEMAIGDPCLPRLGASDQLGGVHTLALMRVPACQDIAHQGAVRVVDHQRMAGQCRAAETAQRRQPLLAGQQVVAIEHKRQPGKLAGTGVLAITGTSRSALPCTNTRSTVGSQPLTLSYNAAGETGKRSSSLRAAACSEGRKPSDTNIIGSTTVENSSSREHCRWRCASNTSSIHAAGNA